MAMIPLPTFSVTIRWSAGSGSASKAWRLTTGTGSPRTAQSPRTDGGAPETGSIGSSRIVSTTFSSGRAHSRVPARHNSQEAELPSGDPVVMAVWFHRVE